MAKPALLTRSTSIEPRLPAGMLTGLPGKAKTFMLNQILADREGLHVTVSANDMREMNIDAASVKQGGPIVSLGGSSLPVTVLSGVRGRIPPQHDHARPVGRRAPPPAAGSTFSPSHPV
jgi:hypothetical protein